jgi:hypothetical protein
MEMIMNIEFEGIQEAGLIHLRNYSIIFGNN